MFKFLINNFDYTNEVTNIGDIKRAVNYNDKNFVWSDSFPTSFTGIGSLFSMLKSRIIANQFCTSLDVIVKKKDGNIYYTIFRGKLFMSDVTFDLSKNEVNMSFVNNDWQTRIENNLEVPVPMDARKSKSSNDLNVYNIVAATSIQLGDFTVKNRTTSATVTRSNVRCWNIDAMFRHIINYISDGQVQYYSQYLLTGYLDYGAKLAVTKGYNLRTGGQESIEVTFMQLFEACRRALNLVMYFEGGESGNRVLRIEDALTVSGAPVGLSFTDIQDVKLKYDQNSYYSSVKVGGGLSFQNNTEIGTDYWYPKVEGVTYASEKFAVNNSCNVSNVLDLTIDEFIYDHNKIEDCIAYDNEEYDQELFFICHVGISPSVTDYLNLSSATHGLTGFFNQQLINKAIIERHDVYGDLIKHHGLGSDTFLAYSGYGDFYSNFPVINTQANPITSYYPMTPTNFPNDFAVVTFGQNVSTPFDNNGNYNNAEPYSYVAPATGLYRFQTKDHWGISPITGNFYHFYAILTVYNSANVITKQYVKKHKAVKYIYLNAPVFRAEDESVGQTYNGAPEPYTGLDAVSQDGGGTVGDQVRTFAPYEYYNLLHYSFSLSTDNTVYLDSGDYVTHSAVFVESDLNRRNNSNVGAWPNPLFPDGYGATFVYKGESFGCNYSLTGGDVKINTRDGSGKLRRLNFSTFMSDANIRSVMSNSQSKIGVVHDGNNFTGKIMNFTTNDLTNICTFDLKLD